MRRIIQFVFIVLTAISGLLSLMVLGTAQQISKNRGELADMKDRVQAIQDFHNRNSRFPSHEELKQLSDSLRTRWYRKEYYLDISPRENTRTGYPSNWPATGGWVLSFWRGEWDEYYSSWDDHYTLADKLSWWYYNGPLMFSPLLFLLFLGSSYALKERQRRF